MNQKEPDFAIIVLFGRGELEPCLSSLLKQSEENFEIIGVVGGETPKVNDPRVKFLVIPDPNPAKRRNQAVAVSRGKSLAFIDDDAIAPEDWLAKAKKILEEYTAVPGFGGVNLAPENLTWREQITDLILTDKYFGSGSGSYKSGGKAHSARPGELHLSNFFLRKEFFDAVKGFNEKIGYGGEDSEMVYWIRKMTGKNFRCFPEVFVWHRRRQFGWEFLKRNLKFRWQNGRMVFLYPELYLWNKSLWLALMLIIIFLSLYIFFRDGSFILIIPYFLYCFIRSLYFLKSRKWLCLIAPFAYFIHHSTYLLGLSAGLMEGLFRGRKSLRQLLGRENLQ